MTYQGIVQNGVIVIPNGPVLPEGTQVSVAVLPSTSNGEPAMGEPQGETIGQKMVRIALMHSGRDTKLPADLAANHDHYIHGTPKRT